MIIAGTSPTRRKRAPPTPRLRPPTARAQPITHTPLARSFPPGPIPPPRTPRRALSPPPTAQRPAPVPFAHARYHYNKSLQCGGLGAESKLASELQHAIPKKHALIFSYFVLSNQGFSARISEKVLSEDVSSCSPYLA